MATKCWYSPLFENESGGGAMLALPYELLGDWKAEDDYDEVIDDLDQFCVQPIGNGAGVFVSDDDGIHEAHWMRPSDGLLYLVVWSAWDDPDRPSLPENAKEVARRWARHEDPRQTWLEGKLAEGRLEWEVQETTQTLSSGVLFLLYGEDAASKARLARPRALAGTGQTIPVGLAPGKYQIETATVCELPDGDQFCLLCRWRPVTT
jgi:hypothetical protein